MTRRPLGNCTILVVEDEYVIAELLRLELEDIGATVIGPVHSVSGALALLDSGGRIDAGILDVNLGHETSFPIAEMLTAKSIPFIFTTGYNSADIPAEWRHIQIETKPLRIDAIVRFLIGIRPVSGPDE